jgi:RNA polymerase sigma-70 factor (ECF subfamily)
MPEREDHDLLIAAGRGDREAFGLLVERHHRGVIQFVHRFLGSIGRDAAEDLAQDAFLSAWQAAPSFEPRAQVRTWLLRIATNACLNYRRRGRLRRALSLDDGASADIPGGPGPAEAAETRERAVEVRQAVAALPPRQRVAIILRHFQGLTYAEIGDVLGISVSAVESMLFRARKTLRASLSRRQDSPQVIGELGAES